MALADPELELLKEILSEDPADDAHLEVAREYVRRKDWSSAMRVLDAATDAGASEPESWSLLAQAAFNSTQYLRALVALERFGPDLEHSDLLSRIHVEALFCAGKIEAARAAGTQHMLRFPNDDKMVALVERMRDRTPEIQQRRHSSDPLVTAQRAERYAAAGRTDRAVRVYRRLLFHDPGNGRYADRLHELENAGYSAADDLSEELTADMEANRPPRLAMPAPGVATPTPGASVRRRVPTPPGTTAGSAVPLMARDASDEVSRRDIALAIEAQRKLTGNRTPRSVVPDDDDAALAPSSDIMRAAEEIDVDELRNKIREARERRARRRSLIRK